MKVRVCLEQHVDDDGMLCGNYAVVDVPRESLTPEQMEVLEKCKIDGDSKEEFVHDMNGTGAEYGLYFGYGGRLENVFPKRRNWHVVIAEYHKSIQEMVQNPTVGSVIRALEFVAFACKLRTIPV